MTDKDSLLLLKEVEGYSVEELSGMLKMNENTIKVKLFRARQKLVKAAQRLDRATGSAERSCERRFPGHYDARHRRRSTGKGT